MNLTPEQKQAVLDGTGFPWLDNQNPLHVFDWTAEFGSSRPVEIDLGAGDGGYVLGAAAQRPDHHFIAVERLLGRARKIARRALARNLSNLRILRLESGYFIDRMCPPASVDVLHIMFPDPWPKRRHHKNRLIQPPFLQAAHRVLKPGGELRFTTDHAGYFDWAMEVWKGEIGWTEGDLWDHAADPKTEFQLTFDQEGRPTHRARWIRTP
jgi:tRNA (guanine-N7-)-methyltransferase